MDIVGPLLILVLSQLLGLDIVGNVGVPISSRRRRRAFYIPPVGSLFSGPNQQRCYGHASLGIPSIGGGE